MIRFYERTIGGDLVLECAICCALVFADDERADWRAHEQWHEFVEHHVHGGPSRG